MVCGSTFNLTCEIVTCPHQGARQRAMSTLQRRVQNALDHGDLDTAEFYDEQLNMVTMMRLWIYAWPLWSFLHLFLDMAISACDILLQVFIYCDVCS